MRTWPSISCTAPAPAGAVPLTLQEALAKGSVQVVETGRVNELQIENTGAEQVFIQAGDIVKGGKQDRVLTVSFLLPAKSGRAADRLLLRRAGPLVGARQGGPREVLERQRGDAVASGAAGHGRAAARGAGAPSRTQRGNLPSARQRVQRERDEVGEQAAAGLGLGRHHAEQAVAAASTPPVASPQSASSLQLSLENEKLKEARTAYIGGAAAGRREGRRHRRLRRRHQRQDERGQPLSLQRAVPEDVGASSWPPSSPRRSARTPARRRRRHAAPGPAGGDRIPGRQPRRAKPTSGRSLPARARRSRDADKSLYNEARGADGNWIHRSYLAK